MRERLAGEREPRLRDRVPPERLELAFAGAGDERGLAAAVQRLRDRVRCLQPLAANAALGHA
jgi:hypothetical protein